MVLLFISCFPSRTWSPVTLWSNLTVLWRSWTLVWPERRLQVSSWHPTWWPATTVLLRSSWVWAIRPMVSEQLSGGRGFTTATGQWGAAAWPAACLFAYFSFFEMIQLHCPNTNTLKHTLSPLSVTHKHTLPAPCKGHTRGELACWASFFQETPAAL